MSKGMEMLVSTVIKAVGLNPEEVINGAKNFAAEIFGQVKKFDARLAEMEKQQAQMIEQNAAFIAVLKDQGLMRETLEKIAAPALEVAQTEVPQPEKQK